MEIQEIIRRWQAGDSQRKIALGTGLSRDTIAKYVAAAQEEGIVRDGLVATAEELSRLATIGQSGPRQAVTPGQDLLEPWADQIYQWLTGDRLQLTRIQELLTVRGCAVSYPSLRRFILKRNWRRRSQTTVRMEDTPPGEVAEADFGRLGMITDPATGRRQAVWALIHRAGLLSALLRLAHAESEAGGRHRRTGSGVGLLRRGAPLSGHRQLPASGGGTRPAASALHQRLPGILAAPRFHRRCGAGAETQARLYAF